MLRSLLVILLMLSFAGEISGKRTVLPRPKVSKLKYEPTGTRMRWDAASQQTVEYSVNGRIDFDEKAGSYLLTWMGPDQKTHNLVYEPPSKVDVTIEASVEYDRERRIYRYTYLLKSLPTSQQKLRSFYLETKAAIEDWRSPDSSWYTRLFTAFLLRQFNASAGITWSQSMEGKLGLPPGTEARGFSFSSSGLPTIVRCYVAGRTETLRSSEEVPDELLEAIGSTTWRLPHGLTVGPGSLPEVFDQNRFSLSILEMLKVSVAQGWIESPSEASFFRQKMSQLRDALRLGRKPDASRIVNSMLDRISREEGQAVLPEAASLLRTNLEYLKAKLQL